MVVVTSGVAVVEVEVDGVEEVKHLVGGWEVGEWEVGEWEVGEWEVEEWVE